MKAISYIMMAIFSIIALSYLKSEQHIEWCMTMICVLLAMLNAGVREIHN